MRDVAVVSFAQSPCAVTNRRDDMAELLGPVVRDAISAAGIDRSRVDFFCSGSHDFYEGRTFSYIQSLETVGAWPPIKESHVEMDAAWAVYEAWTWLQLGEGDIALVYGVGRGSLTHDLDDVSPTQLDPYYLYPLQPHRCALAGLQARACIEAGITDETQMAEAVSRSLARAKDNAFAQQSGDHSVSELLAEPYFAAPLRERDIAPVGDAAAAVILAAGDVAAELNQRPAWIRGIDHRIDSHYPGFRDLADGEIIARTAAGAAKLAGFSASDATVAELNTEYSYQEQLLKSAIGLAEGTRVNESGGPLAGFAPTASGLVRIGEVAATISAGDADRGVAHASNGQALQQNLVCLMEGSQ